MMNFSVYSICVSDESVLVAFDSMFDILNIMAETISGVGVYTGRLD